MQTVKCDVDRSSANNGSPLVLSHAICICDGLYMHKLVCELAGGLDHLKGYLHKERCCVETDIELECAKLATLAYVVEVLERSQQNIQNKRVDKASQC